MGRTLEYQQVNCADVFELFRDSEELVFFVHPRFSHELAVTGFGVAAIRLTPAFDFEPLAVGFAGQDEEAHAGGPLETVDAGRRGETEAG